MSPGIPANPRQQTVTDMPAEMSGCPKCKGEKCLRSTGDTVWDEASGFVQAEMNSVGILVCVRCEARFQQHINRKLVEVRPRGIPKWMLKNTHLSIAGQQ